MSKYENTPPKRGLLKKRASVAGEHKNTQAGHTGSHETQVYTQGVGNASENPRAVMAQPAVAPSDLVENLAGFDAELFGDLVETKTPVVHLSQAASGVVDDLVGSVLDGHRLVERRHRHEREALP